MITPLQNWKTIKRGYKHGQRTYYGASHRGIDCMVPVGTPVFAVKDCKVVVSKRFLQGGNTVWMEFNDPKYGELVMRYLHLNTLPNLGLYPEGSIIAYSGNSGTLTHGAHLHVDLSINPFNLYDFSNFIDPEEYFKEVEWDSEFIKKWEGKFILDVDELGKLYYVYEGKRYYVRQETTMQSFAERFATGFKHEDIEKIPIA